MLVWHWSNILIKKWIIFLTLKSLLSWNLCLAQKTNYVLKDGAIFEKFNYSITLIFVSPHAFSVYETKTQSFPHLYSLALLHWLKLKRV